MRLNAYTDIDEMPVFNWFKINATQDLSYLLIRRRRINDKEQLKLGKLFDKLYDQYIAQFGFNEQFLEILKKRKQIALMQIKQAEKNDRGLITLIKVQQEELAQMQATGPSTSTFYEIKDYVENRVGYQINIHQMSVTEFFTKLKGINSNG